MRFLNTAAIALFLDLCGIHYIIFLWTSVLAVSGGRYNWANLGNIVSEVYYEDKSSRESISRNFITLGPFFGQCELSGFYYDSQIRG